MLGMTLLHRKRRLLQRADERADLGPLAREVRQDLCADGAGAARRGIGHDRSSLVLGPFKAPVPAAVLTGAAEAGAWRISREGQEVALLPEPVLRFSSIIMVWAAVRAGAGVALLPRSMVAEDLASGRLVSWGAAIDRTVGV